MGAAPLAGSAAEPQKDGTGRGGGGENPYAGFPPASACAANLALASSIFRP